MKKFAVYRNGIFEGSTQAISDRQAINNVRHNNYGESESQFENYWEAVDIDEEEAKKAREDYKKKMQEAVERAKAIWKDIPEGSTVISYHPPCEFYPFSAFKGIEPDLISRGEVDGVKCDLGFFRGNQNPTVFRTIEEFIEEDPQKQMDLWEF